MANSLIVVNHIPRCIEVIADKYRSAVTAHDLNKVAFSTWWYAVGHGADDWTDWLIEDQIVDSLRTRDRCLPGPFTSGYHLDDILVEVGLHGTHLDGYYEETIEHLTYFIPELPLPRYRALSMDSFELRIRGALHEHQY